MTRRLVLVSIAAVGLTACNPPEAKAPEVQAPAASVLAPHGTSFAAGPAVTPTEVTALITASGATAAVAALDPNSETPTRWSTVMRGIALGEPAWLAIVSALEPGTENSSAYDLNDALHDALINNAAGALGTIQGDEDLRPEAFCAIDLIEAPPSAYAAFYDAATPAVEAVTDPALAEKKAACLTFLKARTGA